MKEQNTVDLNKAIVRSFYEGGTDSEKKTYGEIFHPAFHVSAPNYLPWGGTSDLETYLADVLHQVTAVLDFTRVGIVSLIGEGEDVVIVIDIGLQGTAHTIQISEHWTFKDGKAINLWVAYYEPLELMNLIARNAAKK